MAGSGHRALKAGLLTLAVALLLFGAFMALVTTVALTRTEYGGALVSTAVSALLVWGGVRLVRTARRRGPSPVRGGRSDTWARTGAYGGRRAGKPLSRGQRIVRVCCSVPLLLGSAYLLLCGVLSVFHDMDGRVTGLFLGFGLLAGRYGLQLVGIVGSSGGGSGGPGGDVDFGASGGGDGAG